ncbi:MULTISPECIES: aspartate carbamoyltransferase [unclassified Nocardioides]|uniref:aspartate carbamoyltransferase n=1 Tax=unclassified Nocardioides TaxID=2615069 RepID=UPI000056FBCE|nr:MULTISPECIES: aspartate carbamoyltransferase [unclassified Nocardioides]ABL80552.1 aspartate carbamoyltransferase [Nocardioides sp. JS614]
MKQHLLSIDDLAIDAVDALFVRAQELSGGPGFRAPVRHAALLFFETSLRTRTGFVSAAHRLGWPTPIEVLERRASASSMPESLRDTVGVVSAYFDTLIVRHDGAIADVVPLVRQGTVVINAGDRGPSSEHPTQALIDVFAMSQLVGEIQDLSIVVAGDLRMRAARSLLNLLARRPPRGLVLVTDPALTEGLELPVALREAPMVDSYDDLERIDALHAIGIPNGSVEENVRSRLRVDARVLARLSARGKVFSPMPVIDEVDRDIRGDPRLAFLEQSALALPVRMAVLESFTL